MKDYVKNIIKLNAFLLLLLVSKIAQADTLQAEVDNIDVTDQTEELIKGDMEMGEKLFTGSERFENKGPSCITCHNLDLDNVITGGALAKDLTKAYSRLGGAGVSSMMSSPPFPAMKTAYENHPLTEAEIKNIEVFLQDVDEAQHAVSTTNYGYMLLLWGLVVLLCLLFVAGIVWYSRKRDTVKKSILSRQLSSK